MPSQEKANLYELVRSIESGVVVRDPLWALYANRPRRAAPQQPEMVVDPPTSDQSQAAQDAEPLPDRPRGGIAPQLNPPLGDSLSAGWGVGDGGDSWDEQLFGGIVPPSQHDEDSPIHEEAPGDIASQHLPVSPDDEVLR